MTDDPTRSLTPVQDLEQALERLPEVRAARVVATASGRIQEIHLVTDGTKAPKQLTRDVETVAITQGIDIDRRTISIAQMPETEWETAERPGLTLVSVAVTIEGAHVTCRVRVSRSDEVAIGEAAGAASRSGRPRLVATATLDSVSSLVGAKVRADCDSASIVQAGDQRVALAVLVFVNDDGEQSTVPGVATVRGDADSAVALAVLDAVRRGPGV